MALMPTFCASCDQLVRDDEAAVLAAELVDVTTFGDAAPDRIEGGFHYFHARCYPRAGITDDGRYLRETRRGTLREVRA
jgi:hypothetical protein